jgi:trans-aconitate 2-methyltransferase
MRRREPTRCDLCGTDESHPLLEIEGRSLTSDSRVVPMGIEKVECRRCGLARNARQFAAEDLASHYRDAYVLAAQADIAEPLLPRGDGSAPRSEVFFAWIEQALARAGRAEPRSILEIGCGEGRLLCRMADRWPEARVRGVDLSPEAVEAARQRGLSVDVGGFADLGGSYDLVYAVAVLEHLPSPREFFATVAPALGSDGVLVVTQPAQDHPSSDIFFVDHLWHFAAAHVEALAATAGLVPAAVVPNDSIPTFSLHALIPGEPVSRDVSGPIAHEARRAVTEWQARFRRLDEWLAARDDRPLAVWGVGQTFDLLRAYSDLDGVEIAAGIEDNLARFPAGSRPFPVLSLEAAASSPAAPDVLLTFAPSPAVERRLEAARLRFFAPLA